MASDTSKTASLRYSGYWPGDESRIVSFFHDLGYDDHTEDSWKWNNRTRLLQYAEREAQIIAHYAVQPRRCRMDDQTVRGGLGLHLGADPEHRSTPILSNTLNRLANRCRKAGLSFIFGFPNDNSWLFLTRLAGWTPVKDIPQLVANLGNLPRANGPPRSTDLVFRSRHADAIREFVPSHYISVQKTLEHLDWRYAECPHRSYAKIETDAGFVIVKTYDDTDVKYGHLLEWGVQPEDTQTLGRLLKMAAAWFWERDVDVLSTWLPDDHPAYPFLSSWGFAPEGFTTHFGYKSLDDGLVSIENRPWFLTMGDSDVF